ncbi:uncharacterized protein [Prorops nasuta]|uniref:uncharacterized protein n=1 Tax=Prorops nasuta TaxID=863751 RepID=UPI0034CEB0A8
MCYMKAAKEYPEAAEQLPFHKVKRNMYKWRNCLPKINSLKKLEKIINDNKFRKFFTYSVKDKVHRLHIDILLQESNNFLIILYDKQFVKKLLRESDVMSIDGTFEILPKFNEKLYQMVTILSNYKKKFIPFLWALTTYKEEKTYASLINFIKLKITSIFNPKKIVTDFEAGLQKSITTTLPHTKLQGCYFHYVHSINRKIEKLGFLKKKSNNLTINDEVKIKVIVREICNLPLLPEEATKVMFEKIRKTAEKEKFYSLLVPFFNYFEQFWLHRVTPKIVNVFLSETRTNNSQERYHEELKKIIGSHPNFSFFISKMMDVLTMYRLEFNQIKRGSYIFTSNMSSSSKIFNNWIKKEWSTFQNFEQLSNAEKNRKYRTFLDNSIVQNKNFMEGIKKLCVSLNSKLIIV